MTIRTASVTDLRIDACNAPRRVGLLQRLARAVARLDRLLLERDYLAEMDERTLRDIGVSRADVDAARRRPIPWAALLFRS